MRVLADQCEAVINDSRREAGIAIDESKPVCCDCGSQSLGGIRGLGRYVNDGDLCVGAAGRFHF